MDGAAHGLSPTALGLAVIDITAELHAAMELFPRPMASPHEGIGVIEEEFDELKSQAFWGKKAAPNATIWRREMRREAVQLAAMAIRFMIEICAEPEAKTDG